MKKIRSAITVSLVPEAKGGPFVYWDGLEAACAKAREHGFDGIEIFAPDAETISDPGVARLTERFGLSVAAVGTGAGWVKHKLRLTDPDSGVRAKARQFVLRMLEAAAPHRAPVILGSMQGRWEGAVSKDQALDWFGESLIELDGRASALGTRLFIEPLNRYETNLLNTVGEACEAIRSRGLKSTRVLADLFHMNIEETDLLESLRMTGALLGHVHFADSNRRAMGYGHLDAGAVVRVLKSIDFHGFVSAEVVPLPSGEAAALQTIRQFRASFG